jgi:hypothetical protein
METTTKFRIVKFMYEKELNNTTGKSYATKQDAVNAGNSWMNDCTVHGEIRKQRWFDVVELKN